MSWIRPVLRSSLSAVLGPDLKSRPGRSVEPARKALLKALGEQGGRLNPQLRYRLQHLQDARSLWYARAELMAALSQMHGEEQAAQALRDITPAFEGLLPKSLLKSGRLQRE